MLPLFSGRFSARLHVFAELLACGADFRRSVFDSLLHECRALSFGRTWRPLRLPAVFCIPFRLCASLSHVFFELGKTAVFFRDPCVEIFFALRF